MQQGHGTASSSLRSSAFKQQNCCLNIAVKTHVHRCSSPAHQPDWHFPPHFQQNDFKFEHSTPHVITCLGSLIRFLADFQDNWNDFFLIEDK